MKVLTQENLRRFKYLGAIIKGLSSHEKSLKSQIKHSLEAGEKLKTGVLFARLSTTSRASLSKDKVISAFLDVMSISEIERRLSSIPKTETTSAKVEFLETPHDFNAQVEGLVWKILDTLPNGRKNNKNGKKNESNGTVDFDDLR